MALRTHMPFDATSADQLALVEVTQAIPTIACQIPYATPDNFSKQPVYSIAKCYLRVGTIHKLNKAQQEFLGMGYGLKIWDGYRPLAIQKLFWELMPDERYVANPSRGSCHNRGAAVDVTLINKDGHELPMPTGFDDFSERAHRNFMDLSEEVIKNRQLLDEVMTRNGFKGLATEWWHFDDADWQKYDILDIPFDDLG